MEFDYYKEYLTIISNKILLWECWEKQIFINLTYDQAKIDQVKKRKEEKMFQNFNFFQAAKLLMRC